MEIMLRLHEFQTEEAITSHMSRSNGTAWQFDEAPRP